MHVIKQGNKKWNTHSWHLYQIIHLDTMIVQIYMSAPKQSIKILLSCNWCKWYSDVQNMHMNKYVFCSCCFTSTNVAVCQLPRRVFMCNASPILVVHLGGCLCLAAKDTCASHRKRKACLLLKSIHLFNKAMRKIRIKHTLYKI